MGYGNFYDLDAWKRARRFRHLVMEFIKCFPTDEKFELASQLRRAVRSIQANIAEGHGRNSFRDEHRFLIIARGSHAECLSHLIEASDSGYLNDEQMRNAKAEWDASGQVLNGYLRFVQSQINLQSGPKPDGTVEESELLYDIDGFAQPDDAFFQILSDRTYS